MEIFHVRWSDYKQSQSYTIGVLIYDNHWYFKYDKNNIMEAIQKGFRPFPDMTDIQKTYESSSLFPVFSVRYGSPEESQSLRLLKNNSGDVVTDHIFIKHIEDKERTR